MENLDELKKKYKFHRETLSFFKELADAGLGSSNETSIEEARKSSEEVAKKFSGDVEFDGDVKEHRVPLSSKLRDSIQTIPITSYRSKNCNLVMAPPIFVYFHGGGNVTGSRKTHSTICKIFSRDAPCIVVNVEYRLGPENKFPASHGDASSAVRWVQLNKSLLGGVVGPVHESKVGVGGDGAGARLAAVVCHEISNIDFQVLVCPVLDLSQNYPLQEEFQIVGKYYKSFGEGCSDNFINECDVGMPRASPILYADFKNLPASLIIVADCDMYRDQANAYHKKMEKSGASSQLYSVKGVLHGFFNLPGHYKECCKIAHEKVSKFIKNNS